MKKPRTIQIARRDNKRERRLTDDSGPDFVHKDSRDFLLRRQWIEQGLDEAETWLTVVGNQPLR
jgi:hypothetical protein